MVTTQPRKELWCHFCRFAVKAIRLDRPDENGFVYRCPRCGGGMVERGDDGKGVTGGMLDTKLAEAVAKMAEDAG